MFTKFRNFLKTFSLIKLSWLIIATSCLCKASFSSFIGSFPSLQNRQKPLFGEETVNYHLTLSLRLMYLYITMLAPLGAMAYIIYILANVLAIQLSVPLASGGILCLWEGTFCLQRGRLFQVCMKKSVIVRLRL